MTEDTRIGWFWIKAVNRRPKRDRFLKILFYFYLFEGKDNLEDE